MRFKGRFNQNLDSKGRLSIPAPLREQMANLGVETLVVTITDRCLEIYPEIEWEKYLDKFDKLPQVDEDVELMHLFHISQASDVTPDKSGRVLVPLSLREQVEFKKEIVVIGSKSKIQVFAKDVWKKVEAKAKARFAGTRSKYSTDLN